MVKTIFVTPKHGYKVPHPSTGVFIANEGEIVEANSYWTRREMADEVTISEARKADETPSETKDETADKVDNEQSVPKSKKSQGGN